MENIGLQAACRSELRCHLAGSLLLGARELCGRANGQFESNEAADDDEMCRDNELPLLK